MAVDLETRPADAGADEHDPIKKSFDELTSREHMARDGVPGELSGAQDQGDADEATAASSAGDQAPDRSASGTSDSTDDKLGKGYQGKDSQKSNRPGKWWNRGSKTKKRLALVGVAVGGSAGAGILMFVLMLPLKIESMITNIDNYFGTSTEHEMSTETDNLLSSWISRDILPNLGKTCHSTVSAGCVTLDHGASNNPLTRLYNGWKQGKVEQKLANKYDIVLGKKGNTYYIDFPAGNATISPSQMEDLKNGKMSIFDLDYTTKSGTSSTKDLRAAVKSQMDDAFKDLSLRERVYDRYQVGKYLETKLGVKRCIIACNIRDNFHDTVNDKKAFGKNVLIQRVIEPFSEEYAYLFTCLVTPGSCSTDDGSVAAGDDDKQSTTQKAVQASLQRLSDSIGEDTAKQLAQTASDISENGLSAVIVEKVVASFAGEATGEAAGEAVPVWNLVSTTAGIVGGVQTVGPLIKDVGYGMKAAEAVGVYSMFKTTVSEMHSGHVDPTEVGSITGLLSNGASGSGCDESQSPLYTEINNQTGSPNTSATGCKCNNGSASTAAKPCDELQLTSGNGALSALSASFSSVFAPFKPIIDVVNIINRSISFVISVVMKTTGLSSLMGNMTSFIKPFVTWVSEKAVSPLVTDTSDGGRMYEAAAAGADVSQNDTNQTLLGAPQTSDQTAAAIRNSVLTQQKQQFDQESMFARMFSTSSPYSLVSRMALAMPGSFTEARSDVASMLTDPFRTVGSLFGSILSGKSVIADTPTVDPFGVPQTAYSDSQIPTDPEAFWNANCQGQNNDEYGTYDAATNTFDDSASIWLNNMQQDQNTGTYMATQPNACLLIYNSIISAGAMFDSSLVPTADTNSSDDSSSSASSTSAATGSAALVGDNGFPGGSCVIYVEWVLKAHSSKYSGGALGDGWEVTTTLGNKPYGYTVNHTPAVHAVVSFAKGQDGADPAAGHVAIVSGINTDGSITIEESNWTNTNAYDTRTIPASEVAGLSYAHTEVGWH